LGFLLHLTSLCKCHTKVFQSADILSKTIYKVSAKELKGDVKG